MIAAAFFIFSFFFSSGKKFKAAFLIFSFFSSSGKKLSSFFFLLLFPSIILLSLNSKEINYGEYVNILTHILYIKYFKKESKMSRIKKLIRKK